MFIFLSIYFVSTITIPLQDFVLDHALIGKGSYYRQIHRSPHLSIEILDLDSLASPQGSVHPAILGPAIREQVQQKRAGELPTLGYYIADDTTAQQFQITQNGQGIDAFDYAVAKVDNQDVWGVMIVNANATSGVWDAITSGAEWTREFNHLGRITRDKLNSSRRSHHIRHFRSTKLLCCRTIRSTTRERIRYPIYRCCRVGTRLSSISTE